LINAALATADVTVVCPYNAAELHQDVLDDALRTHPVLWDQDGPRHTERFDPDGVYADYNRPLTDGLDIAVHHVSKVEELAGLRRAVGAHALGLGLGRARLHDLQYIVTELVTNSLVHTRNRRCQLRISRESHHVICAVLDDGPFTKPLAGRRRPPGDEPGGRGLLMVNLLADLVRTYTSPTGTRIQAYLATG
jgi:anti-sigma regulatory factor (Ser/Thr protein kinase)